MCQDRRKTLIFVGITPYPNGLASSNRLSGLLEGLSEAGWDINVICLAPTKYPTNFDKNKKYYRRQGCHRGVNFKYYSARVKSSKFKIARMFSLFWGILSFPIHLNFYKNNVEHKIFLTNLTKPFFVIYFYLINLILQYRFVLLRSEIPSFNPIISKWCFKRFDGFLLMTHYLKNYFIKYKKDCAKIQILPMTVENERFSNVLKSPFSFDYIAYAGSISSKKDGIDILLNAYLSISAKFPDIHLVIMGDNTNLSERRTLLNILEMMPLAVQKRIHFSGLIDKKEIPNYLNNSKILALARPNSLQAQAGFPSKLGEYLSTGKPVVATETGEIPLYLKDGETAFLCPPGDVSAFSKKLDFVLSNYSNALIVGLRGKKIAKDIFDTKVQAKKMATFLEKLK